MKAEPSPAPREDPFGPDARPIPDAAPEAGQPPKVTVVIPVYNREKYIGAAIESVLAQTFTDFEILVIDDGSTDGSREVVRSYPDPRIRPWTCPSATARQRDGRQATQMI